MMYAVEINSFSLYFVPVQVHVYVNVVSYHSSCISLAVKMLDGNQINSAHVLLMHSDARTKICRLKRTEIWSDTDGV